MRHMLHGSAIQDSDTPQVLEIDNGFGLITHFRLEGARVVIGRAADADLQLERSSVSRHHAELFHDPFGRWWIRDLGSRNGTCVNGFRTTERILDANDRIEVGDYLLRLCPAIEEADSTAVHHTDVTLLETEEDVATLRPDESAHIAAQHLNLLIRLGQQLLTTETLVERLRLLCLTMVSEEFKGLSAVVLRVPRQGPAASPTALCPPQGQPPRESALSISNSLVRMVQQRGLPALAGSQAHADANNVAQLSSVSHAAALACPIRMDDQDLDLLYVTVPSGCGTNDWLTLTTMAVEQYRLAENAWSARRQSRLNALVKHDLDRASEIQHRLLPRDLAVAGFEVAMSFRPCRWVAGDYLDVVKMPDGGSLMTVADVCGKGLSAAMVASSLHTLVRASVRIGAGLVDVVQVLNDYLSEYLPANRFVTAVFIRVEPGSEALEFINCGHLPPLVLDPAGSWRALELCEFAPLGICTSPFTCKTDSLDPGQVLAMFTDGLFELRNAQGEMYTRQRLAEQMAALLQDDPQQAMSAMAQALDQALDRYQADRLQEDDRTLLLTRRLPGG